MSSPTGIPDWSWGRIQMEIQDIDLHSLKLYKDLVNLVKKKKNLSALTNVSLVLAYTRPWVCIDPSTAKPNQTKPQIYL